MAGVPPVLTVFSGFLNVVLSSAASFLSSGSRTSISAAAASKVILTAGIDLPLGKMFAKGGYAGRQTLID